MDWDLIVKIALPIATLILGRFLDRFLERRSRLISYLGHVSSFTLQGPPEVHVFAHSIVLRNTGRKPCQNVRVGHHVLPNYEVYPRVTFNVVPLQGGGTELHFPVLVPNEQLTISYLYSPPLTWERVNSYTKSDEGFARILRVIPSPQPSRWLVWLAWILQFCGVVSLLYLLIHAILAAIR